jgi:hypothetical protein
MHDVKTRRGHSRRERGVQQKGAEAAKGCLEKKKNPGERDLCFFSFAEIVVAFVELRSWFVNLRT